MNSRRDHRALRRSHVSVDEASSIFGVAKTSLQKMNRAQLARLFRRRAMKLHPDKGGDHDTFVKLTEAYHSLLRIKK
jgi:DnaJ-class molecular chaperone